MLQCSGPEALVDSSRKGPKAKNVALSAQASFHEATFYSLCVAWASNLKCRKFATLFITSTFLDSDLARLLACLNRHRVLTRKAHIGALKDRSLAGSAVKMTSRSRPPLPATPLVFLILTFLVLISPTNAIKFNLQAHRYPPAKCIWNPAHTNALVIVTANIGPGADQRTDIEIVDSSPEKRVYLSKKDIKGETRLAVTTHAEGEVGVCLKNHLDSSTWFGCVVTWKDMLISRTRHSRRQVQGQISRH
jgi:hypothetical protein